VWGIKTSHEDKLNVAAEQKRVLVKEVKSLRKKTEELVAHGSTLQEVNGKLEAAVVALQAEMERRQREFESRLEAASVAAAARAECEAEAAAARDSEQAPPYESAVADLARVGDEESSLNQAMEAMRVSAEVMEAMRVSAEVKKMSSDQASVALSLSASAIVDDVVTNPSPGKLDVFQSASGTSSVLPPPPSQVDPEGNAIGWEAANRSSLLNLDWLSPQQRQLVEERRKDEMVLGQEHEKKKSLIDFTSSLFSHDKEKDEESGAVHASAAAEGDSKISLRRLSAMFTKGDGGSPSHQQSEHRKEFVDPRDSFASSTPTATAAATSGATATSGAGKGEENHSSLAAAAAAGANPSSPPAEGKPRCFRCGGTVEGPKYSTCKCDIPLMAPEEAGSGGAMDSFKGFLTKGKKSAGGLADGFKFKAGSIFSHKSGDEDHSMHSAGAGSTHTGGNASPGPGPGSSDGHDKPSESSHWLDSIAHELHKDSTSTPSVGHSRKSSLLSLDAEDSVVADYTASTASTATFSDRPIVTSHEPDSDDEEGHTENTAEVPSDIQLARRLKAERS
jgi:hypothetical protein